MDNEHRLQASLLLKKLHRREPRIARELEYHVKQIILAYERQYKELADVAEDALQELEYLKVKVSANDD